MENCTIPEETGEIVRAWLLYPALRCPQLNVQPPTRYLSHGALKRNRCPDNIGEAGAADRFGKKAIPREKGGVSTLITDPKRKASIHSRVNGMKKRRKEREREGDKFI